VAAASGRRPLPFEWGATDQRGAANHMKPETVLEAARPIRTGRFSHDDV
jgi:hypothetical protein